MTQRNVVLDKSTPTEVSSETLRLATERADTAEAELASIKREMHPGQASKHSPIDATDGVTALREDAVMAHLLDSLAAGKDIGHYGRLVFAMVARHFLPENEVVKSLMRDRDFSEEQAILMLRQVETHDYNPPKRERLLEWQSQQEFPILPNPEDPDCGNFYRNLKFPEGVYEQIGHYQEEKTHAEVDSRA